MSTCTQVDYSDAVRDDEMRLTEAARNQLCALYRDAGDEDIEAIRIFVAGGGCGGMTYGMTFADQRTPYDKVFRDEGFDIYVDVVALNYLRGVEVDYVDQPMGASFVFNNVFAATGGSGTCGGCGAATGGGGGCG